VFSLSVLVGCGVHRRKFGCLHYKEDIKSCKCRCNHPIDKWDMIRVLDNAMEVVKNE